MTAEGAVEVMVCRTPEDVHRADLRRVAEAWVTERAGQVSRLCPWCGSVAHGRPMVADGFVSFAYAPGLVVVALADAPVGLDVERSGPVPPGFADTAAWTRAEAVLKATGEGLRRDPTEADTVPCWSAPLPLPAPYVGWLALLGVTGARVSVREAPAEPVRTATGRATP
jgi:4'-phosphopantetheinyl transferase